LEQKKQKKIITMTKKVFTNKVQLQYAIRGTEKNNAAVAPGFSKIPGCIWKVWVINEDHKEAGGVYLFESATELEKYLNSNLFASVANNPAFSNLQTNTF